MKVKMPKHDRSSVITVRLPAETMKRLGRAAKKLGVTKQELAYAITRDLVGLAP